MQKRYARAFLVGQSILTETILYLELNFVGILVLIIMLFNLRYKQKAASTFDQQLFIIVMILAVIMLILDAFMYLLDGKTFPSARTLNYAVSTLYYIFQPIICVAWALYADYKLNEKLKRCWALLIAAGVIILINTVLSLLSVKFDIYFNIDANNIYARGQYFWIAIIMSYLFFIYSFALVFTAKSNKKYKMTILLFPLFTFIASILQVLFYGLTLIWTSAVVSCVMVFINIQNTQIATDGLTGLYNRCHLEKYLDAKSGSKKRKVFVIFLDVDDLKSINDTFGHKKGDEALIAVAKILKNALAGKNCLAARYSGDEFCVGGLADGEECVKDLVKQIYHAFSRYNEEHQLGYVLSACLGYAVWNKSKEKEFSVSELISRADAKMYEDKANAGG